MVMAEKRTNNNIGIFSFFAGAGFLDLGFEKTGHFKTVYVNEFHQPFNDIYRYARERMGIEKPGYGHHVEDVCNLLKKKKLAELKKEVEETRQSHQLVGFIGGPPCPDFSVAGKNRGKEGENGRLSGTYAELICKAKPDFFLFENVKGLYKTAKHREFFEHLKKKFRRAGYALTEQLINALEFGTPQDRERIILIGFHKSVFTKLGIKAGKGVLEGFDWDGNKSGKMAEITALPWPGKTPYTENGEVLLPENIREELTVEYWFRRNHVNEHPNGNMFFRPKAALTRFQTVEEGDDKKKCYKRLHRWRYSPTAAYGNNEVHIHPYLPRRISVAEALAVQSLPAEFELPLSVTLTDAFKCIGNGVPFLAAKGIAMNIYDFITRNN